MWMSKRPLTHPTCVENQTGPLGTRLCYPPPMGRQKASLDPPVVARTLSRAYFPEPCLDAAQTGAPWSVPLRSTQTLDKWGRGLAQRAAHALGPSPAVSSSVPVIQSRVPTPATRVHTHTRAHTHIHTHGSYTRSAQTPPRPRPGPCGRPLRRPRTPHAARAAGGRRRRLWAHLIFPQSGRPGAGAPAEDVALRPKPEAARS